MYASTRDAAEKRGRFSVPKVSKQSAAIVKDFGVAEDRSSEVDDYTISFVSIRQHHDLAPILAGLPGGNCSCPHWGYVLKGRVIVRYPDREEVFEPGDAFYMPPGHAPEAEAGTELVQFSPTAPLAAVEAAMMKSMQASDG
jgi:hypothetical protein